MRWLGILTLLLALASCANSYKSNTKKDNTKASSERYYIIILSTSDIEKALQVTKAQQWKNYLFF